MRESGYTLSLVLGGSELLKLCEELSGIGDFWEEHPTHCKDIYLKRENNDLQVAEKMLLFLGLYIVVWQALQKVAPQILQGGGLFFGLMNLAIVCVLCSGYVKVPNGVMPIAAGAWW